MGGVFTATGFPPPGSTFNADEPAASYRGGFALVRALPDAPTNVTATPGDGKATITWQAPAYTGGGPVTSYAILVDPDGTVLTDVTSPTTVTGLTNGAPYTFSVYAVSGEASARPGVSNTVTPQAAPGAPTGVTGTPGNRQVSVSFTPPASNGGSPITGYTVTSNPGNISAGGTTSPITVTGLTNGQSYTFSVTATNAIGTSQPSAPSNPATPTFAAVAPDAPTGVTATAGNGIAVVTFTPPVSDGGATISGYTVSSSPATTPPAAPAARSSSPASPTARPTPSPSPPPTTPAPAPRQPHRAPSHPHRPPARRPEPAVPSLPAGVPAFVFPGAASSIPGR